jgi:hypothetical protein
MAARAVDGHMESPTDGKHTREEKGAGGLRDGEAGCEVEQRPGDDAAATVGDRDKTGTRTRVPRPSVVAHERLRALAGAIALCRRKDACWIAFCRVFPSRVACFSISRESLGCVQRRTEKRDASSRSPHGLDKQEARQLPGRADRTNESSVGKATAPKA